MEPNTKEMLTKFIEDTVNNAKKDGIVLGVSGGVDSALCLALAVRALGKERVHGLSLYSDCTSQESSVLAAKYMIRLGVKNYVYNIEHILHSFLGVVSCAVFPLEGNQTVDRLRIGNAYARIRMMIAYDYALKNNLLVMGTGNRTESLLGYYTVWGDGAHDLNPISGLYKTEVWELAKELGVPDAIVNRRPSAELWEGQTDEGEIGMSYEAMDNILRYFFEMEDMPKQVTVEQIEKIKGLVEKNRFKPEIPYTPESKMRKLPWE